MSTDLERSTWPLNQPSARHRFISVLFISIVWTSSLLFLLLGLPVLIFQKISSAFTKKA
ncbi:MAG: hypothetical protein PSX80_13190 [bacterium]|nr:hypothetical protein [bacterium]